MVPRMGFTLFLSQCYFAGVFWTIGFALANSELGIILVAILGGGFVTGTAGALRTLFSWQVRPDQKALVMSGYDAVDLVAEALSNFVLAALFSAIVTPKCFERGSVEAQSDVEAGAPLFLCSGLFLIAASIAFFILRPKQKDGSLRPVLDNDGSASKE